MAKPGRQDELLGLAIQDLDAYRCEMPPAATPPYSENVRIVTVGGRTELALIQTRSSQGKDNRFLFGIILPELARVARVILWVEHGGQFYDVPSQFLRNIYEANRDTAGYSGVNNRGWRVNVYHDDIQELSSQNSDERHNLTPFVRYVGEPDGGEAVGTSPQPAGTPW